MNVIPSFNSYSKKTPSDYVGYEDISGDGYVLKKVNYKGFGSCPVNGMEATGNNNLFIKLVHYMGQLEDERTVDNTYAIQEPHTFLVGNNTSVIPGLEMAIKTMNFTERATVIVFPKYGYWPLKMKKELKKSLENDSESEDNDEAIKQKKKEEVIPEIPEKPIADLEPNIAKYYVPLSYEVELIKHDKPRKPRTQLSSDEKVSEAANLKELGNDLFKEKSFLEAIVRYKDGFDYLKQIPTNDITSKVIELRSVLNLNIANCHINIHEYTTALKFCKEATNYKITPKLYYYQAVSIKLWLKI